MNEPWKPAVHESRTVVGRLSGRVISIPDVDQPPMPALAEPGVILNGTKAEGFGEIGASRGYPDVRSFRRKFGLLVPATNTSMEHELWSLIASNTAGGLDGVGLQDRTRPRLNSSHANISKADFCL